jgi:hypothetical protein
MPPSLSAVRSTSIAFTTSVIRQREAVFVEMGAGLRWRCRGTRCMSGRGSSGTCCAPPALVFTPQFPWLSRHSRVSCSAGRQPPMKQRSACDTRNDLRKSSFGKHQRDAIEHQAHAELVDNPDCHAVKEPTRVHRDSSSSRRAHFSRTR